MPLFRELTVGPDLVSRDEAFFGPLKGIPLHALFQVEKSPCTVRGDAAAEND